MRVDLATASLPPSWWPWQSSFLLCPLGPSPGLVVSVQVLLGGASQWSCISLWVRTKPKPLKKVTVKSYSHVLLSRWLCFRYEIFQWWVRSVFFFPVLFAFFFPPWESILNLGAEDQKQSTTNICSITTTGCSKSIVQTTGLPNVKPFNPHSHAWLFSQALELKLTGILLSRESGEHCSFLINYQHINGQVSDWRAWGHENPSLPLRRMMKIWGCM